MAATLAQDAQQMPFIKNLASSDRKLRTASLSSLQSFLSSRRALSPLDSRKLWTGLYYALWMTDRPRPQQSLASEIASLLFSLPPSCAREWLSGFWAVLGSQWPHIEALRLDKFLLLARRVFAAHVRFARERGFASEDGGVLVLELMREWCFDPQDERRVAIGLRMHVLDVWVDELERERALGGDLDMNGIKGENRKGAREGADGFVRAVGGMVEDVARKAASKAVRQRALESWEDERLPWVQAEGAGSEEEEEKEEEDDDEDEDDEWGGLDD